MAKKNKEKKLKMTNYRSEEQNEALRFVKILLVLVLSVIIVYIFTKVFITKDLLHSEKEEKAAAGQLNYNITLVGNMLNKPEKEYYVFAFSNEELNASYYNNLINLYNQNEKFIPIYTTDLDNTLNQKFISSDQSNLNVKDISDLRIKDIALIKIKQGKIVKALEAEEDIVKELKRTKDTTK